MQCEEARRSWRAGTSLPDAEEHFRTCPACFEVLEAEDPLVDLLRAARPPAAQPSPALARRILERWQPARVSWRLGIVAAAALALAALVILGLAVWSAPGLAEASFAAASITANTGLAVLVALLAAPRVLLLGYPIVLAGYLVLTIVLCALWSRLYWQIQGSRRDIAR